VSAVPLLLRRPFLIARDLLVDRDAPDLQRLDATEDPAAFVWAILPHAARTFSACIALLPEDCAAAAAVGYLYCRSLDTYEDLHPDRRAREAALRAFAERLHDAQADPPPAIPDTRATDRRDEAHLLLVRRIDRVDRVYATLPEPQREAIRWCVGGMAEGMCWSSATFAAQGGVLEDQDQLLRYCRYVLGIPVEFTWRLLRPDVVDPAFEETCMRVGELVQLANVTRDIEKDLARGIAYHPALRAWLGTDPRAEDSPPDLRAAVRDVRAGLLRLALERGPSYRRMVEDARLGRFSLARASALLMLLFTDRYYRGCAARCDLPGWDGARTVLGLLWETFPASFSPRWTRRVLVRVERAWAEAAASPP